MSYTNLSIHLLFEELFVLYEQLLNHDVRHTVEQNLLFLHSTKHINDLKPYMFRHRKTFDELMSPTWLLNMLYSNIPRTR